MVFTFTITLQSRQYNSQIWSPFSVLLVNDPKLYFPLNQDIPQSTRDQETKSLETVCLWETGIANLRKYFVPKEKFDGVCQFELKISYVSLLPSLFVIYYDIESNARNHISLNLCTGFNKCELHPQRRENPRNSKMFEIP